MKTKVLQKNQWGRSKKMKKEKDKYSVLNNYIWTRRLFERLQGKRYHFISFAWIILSVIAPFIGMAFPAFAVFRLQSEESPILILLSIMIFAFGIRLIGTLQIVLTTEQRMVGFLARIGAGDPIQEHLLSIDYEKYESGEGRKKLEAGLNAIYNGNELGMEAFMIQFPTILMNLIGIFIYSLVVFQIHWIVLAYMFVTSLVIGLFNLKVEAYDDKHQPEFLEYLSQKSALRSDIFTASNGKDIRIYHAANWLLKGLKDVVALITKYRKGKYKIVTGENIGIEIFALIRDGAVYFILIREIAKNQITVGKLLLFIGAIAGYSIWVKGFLEGLQKIFLNKASITDYREFLEYGDIEQEDKKKEKVKNQGEMHELKLVNVGYTYIDNKVASLSNINLTIHPGEKLALVGRNGAGKSTLIKIICGLYHPTEGEMYIDGQNVKAISQQAYFKEFSAVFQDVFVFACSVADNVSCQRGSETDHQLVKSCLEKAGLYAKIETTKKGLNTMLTTNLDPEGIELSGGEMQKLMLARALYKNASILVLDEPTAALDPIAESKMYEAYSVFSQGKTSIFISHRLSSTKFCDRICFVENGKIEEMGSHEELLDKDGAYAQMFQVQAQYYQEQLTKEKKNEETEAAYE